MTTQSKTNWPEQGVHHGVPFATYRACDMTSSDDINSCAGKSVSKSLIVDFIKDPADWRKKPKKQTTAAMRAGSLFDCLLTEPDAFKSRYVIAPGTYKQIDHITNYITTDLFTLDWRPNAKDCREWKAAKIKEGHTVLTPDQIEKLSLEKDWNLNSDSCSEWQEKQEKLGLEVITNSQLAIAQEQLAAVMAKPEAAELLDGCAFQVAFRHRTKHPFWSKGLIDVLPDDGETIVDIKTCEPRALESHRSMANHIHQWFYAVQAGAYCEGFSHASGQERHKFKFIFVSSAAPFTVAVVELPLAAILHGADIYRNGVKQLAQCLETNRWPSIWDGTVEIDLPEWAYNQKD